MSVPEEFAKVVRDFVADLLTTFPEYQPLIRKWWKSKEHFQFIEDEEERRKAYEKAESKSVHTLFQFCKKKLPPRFFDLLYQNDEMFAPESEVDTEFLPNLHFKNLWHCDITAKTKETIWKYLQLMLFAVVGTLDNKEAFGDAAKLFEAVDQEEFREKLQDTLSHMQGLFGEQTDASGCELPDPEQINDHITSMLDGKIGQLAREIAEETAESLQVDLEDVTNMKDVFSQLVKNPTKLMALIQTVGNKLDSKLKSGELKESEMLQEATDLMQKMKSIPGMGNIQSMLSKMGMGNLGGKVNTAAMETQLNQRLKLAKTKERIRAKSEANALRKAQEAAQAAAQVASAPAVSEEELYQFFAKTEKPEKTPRHKKNKK